MMFFVYSTQRLKAVDNRQERPKRTLSCVQINRAAYRAGTVSNYAVTARQSGEQSQPRNSDQHGAQAAHHHRAHGAE